MSHMPTFDTPPSGPTGSRGIVVNYVATGLEGTSFLVPIGADLGTDAYAVTWAPAGVTNFPVPDFPTGAGDRTSTYFRVTTADVLTAGDKLTFVLFEES